MNKINCNSIKNFEHVECAIQRFISNINKENAELEEIFVEDSLGRILAEDIIAQFDLPLFNKTLIDGYAVNSSDIVKAEESFPVIINVIDELNVENYKEVEILKNQAVKISTGAILPENADTVVPNEFCYHEDNTVKIFKSFITGANIAKQGDDISKGEILIGKKRKIRAQDIGGVISVGKRKIKVYKQPLVHIIPTGNELLPIDAIPKIGQINETNSFVLKGIIENLGVSCKVNSLVKDDPVLLREAIECALSTSDMVLVSGGSSIGTKDYTLSAIKEINNSKIIAHGIAMRPARQTLLAIVNGKPIIGLPGHPVSNLTSFLVFGKPCLKYLIGSPSSLWQGMKDDVVIDAFLAKDVESPEGREDYVRVRLKSLNNDKVSAYPYAGKSSFISTLVKAHGMIKLSPECTKLYEGDRVKVLLF